MTRRLSAKALAREHEKALARAVKGLEGQVVSQFEICRP